MKTVIGLDNTYLRNYCDLSFQVNFKHYYIHFEPTGDPSSLTGSHWYTNRTIHCFRSHFFP